MIVRTRFARSRELFGWLAGKRRWIRVKGDSMRPTLAPGDCVLVTPPPGALPQIDALVVVRDPTNECRMLIKRVGSRGTNSFAVVSDNPLGAHDSRTFGSLSPDALRGVVTLVWPRRGFLRLP